MGYREDCYGRGLALNGDKTTTGASCISSTGSRVSYFGRGIVRVGDVTTDCPKCGRYGRIIDGESRSQYFGAAAAVDGSLVVCHCPEGSNRVIAPAGEWLGRGKSPEQQAEERQKVRLATRKAEQAAQEKRLAAERERNRVFAKSCLRGEGCNDAGDQCEPHSNFARMAFYQAAPVTDTTARQHTESGKKQPSAEAIPKPKRHSALYKWRYGNHEEMDYQAALATMAGMARVQTAMAGANVLTPIAGNLAVPGTWAVSAARIAVGGIGAPLAGLLVGMMPGRLNNGEQDFIDRMRLEQMREAPTRVRFTWENDTQGNPVPHGWHTPAGQDKVRVRSMQWNNSRQAYTFTTEEDDPLTLIWTPDSSGMEIPAHTGDQSPPQLPGSVMVDPLPDNNGFDSTVSPAPEEKGFADYILILPLPNIPPIYIYLSKPPVEFLEVELYSDFIRRSRQGKYEADHMPSRAAVERYYMNKYPTMDIEQITELSNRVASIVIPKEVHRRVSETFGGRNSDTRIDLDSRDLRAAADSNLDAIKPKLQEYGATEQQIEAVRARVHELNSKIGLYK
ncbi:pyocin [Rahnella sp. SAP-1]|uniref:Pyocin n=1 Tax=Rouxiella aceris TaxID=2703884 RepID=A0A848MH43_9GAMM|nr:S-type pyocin domain-containing protein [Rouxiella aceris]NMP27537.1 pyocin [Rouxiella aceris]